MIGMWKCTFIMIAFIYCMSASAVDLIRYVDSKDHPDDKQGYFIDLLTVVLEASREQYGDYTLQGVAVEMEQGRSSIMLARNEVIDLTWRMTSKEIENKLQAIYFPILRGLMGHRIFIIRAADQSRFSKDMSLSELRNIPVGQGKNWPDTDILNANGFNVTTGSDIYLLMMLEKKRFDFYPRALHEPWLEIKNNSVFVVEENLMLRYFAPVYFYVNKSNNRLHQRLSYGFKKILTSGQFEQFFLTHPITSDIIEKSNAKNRVVFDLNNPLLSKKSKALQNDKRLWIDLSSSK